LLFIKGNSVPYHANDIRQVFGVLFDREGVARFMRRQAGSHDAVCHEQEENVKGRADPDAIMKPNLLIVE
jgi:hypothetical protein